MLSACLSDLLPAQMGLHPSPGSLVLAEELTLSSSLSQGLVEKLASPSSRPRLSSSFSYQRIPCTGAAPSPETRGP